MSVLYYKMVNYIQENYDTYLIDIPGFGFSSREISQAKELTTVEKWENHFTSCFKYFCDFAKLDNFFLVGHSYGGYICTLFFNRFPNLVQKMVLLSPAGMNNDLNNNDFFNTKNHGYIYSKFVDYVNREGYGKKRAFFGLFNRTVLKWMIKRYMK